MFMAVNSMQSAVSCQLSAVSILYAVCRMPYAVCETANCRLQIVQIQNGKVFCILYFMMEEQCDSVICHLSPVTAVVRVGCQPTSIYVSLHKLKSSSYYRLQVTGLFSQKIWTPQRMLSAKCPNSRSSLGK